MKCFASKSSAHREHIDDILSGAKRVLEAGKAANNVLSIPGLEPVANILIALIDRVEVRTPDDLEGSHCPYASSGADCSPIVAGDSLYS